MESALTLSHLLLLALAFHSGESIKCYVCSSLTDSKCADPMTPDSGVNPVDCSSSVMNQAANAFRDISKTISSIGNTFGIDTKPVAIDAELVCSKFDFEAEGKKVTIRACAAPPKTLDYCKGLEESNTKNKMTFCETCNTDLCNGASAVNSVMFLLLPAIALLLASS